MSPIAPFSRSTALDGQHGFLPKTSLPAWRQLVLELILCQSQLQHPVSSTAICDMQGSTYLFGQLA